MTNTRLYAKRLINAFILSLVSFWRVLLIDVVWVWPDSFPIHYAGNGLAKNEGRAVCLKAQQNKVVLLKELQQTKSMYIKIEIIFIP